jgi:hypothetical protein
MLGHVGRTVDIFKIDRESCEWETVDSWFDQGVTLRQINTCLSKVSCLGVFTRLGVHARISSYTDTSSFYFQYTTVHKMRMISLKNWKQKVTCRFTKREPNLKHPMGYSGMAVEYAMIKLGKDFFEGLYLEVERPLPRNDVVNRTTVQKGFLLLLEIAAQHAPAAG